MASNQQIKPVRGTVARDTRTLRTGVVMGSIGGRVQLRPLGGGREWETYPDRCELLEGTGLALVANAMVDTGDGWMPQHPPAWWPTAFDASPSRETLQAIVCGLRRIA
ncbi:hypothetical protein [Streptomyces sp. NPDC088400]|uniref:hypothetical protein n=1 Tax=Streptomyces sp. NPDC088400 TaxID=3365861 RepID=UPI00380AFF38